ncbi:nSTAND1 domain-containing NTPase [Actinoplanes xinjiangensis]|uniref:nSTAND1 domain-containing NTPase n=1 Tax=Actinoplanes xinjiangensis TaxID=512350 RepID=UPI00341415F5
MATEGDQMLMVGDHRRLHDLLLELRRRAGEPSLRKMNGACGVSVGHLSEIFAGKAVPSAEVAVRIAQALRATEPEQARVRYLTEGTEADRSAQRAAESRRPRRTGWEGCPYLGLAPFEERHAQVFYGRRTLTEHLLQRLRGLPPGAGPLLTLGPSGAGKSSLLRAGLMGSLAKGVLAPGCERWPRRVFTPTAEPLLELAVCLADLARTDAISVHRALLAEPAQAHLLARQAMAAAAPGARLVLVVDQLEELFTLDSNPDEQGRFLAALHSLASEGGALVVAGIRGDFVDQALAFPEIRRSAEAGVFPVGAMCESELREAIAGPAAEAGVRVPDDVCAAILDDLRERSLPVGFDSGALPLLSQVMFVMWQSGEAAGLTLENYRRSGGVADIVRTSAERVYESLDDHGRELACRVFLHLTALTDGRATRRPSTRDELRAATGDDRVFEVVEAFAATRLITVTDELVTIAHEELLRCWTRLHEWLRPDLADQALHRSLTEDVRDWQNHGRDPSYLYTGQRLQTADDAARRWAGDVTSQLSLDAAAEEFLQAGHRRARHSRQRVYRAVTVAVVVLLAITGGSAQLLWKTSGNSEKRRLDSLSMTLASASRSRGVDRGTSEQLAAAALQTAATSEALNAAGELLGDAPSVLPSLRGTVEVGGPNGELMATMGVDTVWLWNLQTELPAFAPLTGITGLKDIRVSATGIVITHADEEPAVRFWEPSSGRQIGALTVDQTGGVQKIVLGPRGLVLATCGEDGVVRLWDTVTRELIRPLTGHVGPVKTAQFSPDARSMVTVGTDGTLRLWDVETGRERGKPTSVDPASVSATGFSPDGTLLAAATGDDAVRLWSTATGIRSERLLTGHTGRVVSLAFPPPGPTGPTAPADMMLATSDEDGTVRLWDTVTMRLKGAPLRGHIRKVHALRFSSDGRLLATAGEDKTARLWDTATNQAVGRPLIGHEGPVWRLRFEADSKVLITGSDDDTVRLWDTAGSALTGHGQPVNAVVYSPQNSRMATASTDGTVRLWDPATGFPTAPPITRGIDPVRAVAFRDEEMLATADDSGVVRLWNAATGRRLGRPLTGHAGPVWAVAFSPDGNRMATGGDDATIRRWDTTARSLIGEPLKGHRGAVRTVRFHPDGESLVSGGSDGTIRWWDADSGAPRGEPVIAHNGDVFALAFSADRKLLASGGQDGVVRLWDAASGRALDEMVDRRNGTAVRTVAFSSDSRMLASGSESTTARLWDVASRKPVGAPLIGHTAPIYGLAFHPDRRTLITASGDQTVRRWEIGAFLEPGKTLCDRVGPLSAALWEHHVPDEPFVPTCG